MRFRIYRYNPESDSEPSMEDFQVDTGGTLVHTLVARQMHDTLVACLDNTLIWNAHKANSDRIRLIRLDSGMLTAGNLLDL